jgi:hypothetical protein
MSQIDTSLTLSIGQVVPLILQIVPRAQAPVALYPSTVLKVAHTMLRFRGGMALNKLHFPVPLRYSEEREACWRKNALPLGGRTTRTWTGAGFRRQSASIPHAGIEEAGVAPTRLS